MMISFEDWVVEKFPPQNHPEQKADEVYLGNIPKDVLDTSIGYRYKRLGTIALTDSGVPMDQRSQSKLFPLFVRKDEIENYFYVQAQRRIS